MRKICIILLLLVFLAGCVTEVEKPEIKIIDEVPEPELVVIEEVIEEEINITEEEPGEKIRVIEVIVTETSFDPSIINLTYDETVKLIFKSNSEHNFYAPGLRISKPIKEGETEMFIPTDRKGTFTFWCNILHYGSQHSRMKGRIYIK